MTKKRTPKIGVQPSNSHQSKMPVVATDIQEKPRNPLTKLERMARRERSQSVRIASFGGDFGNSGGGSIAQADSAFYSPQLSTDFLELPQSDREKRELFRFWYSCFPPGAPVLMANGTTRNIEDVCVGDRVPNGFGEVTTVKTLFQNDIKDDIIKMKVRGVQGNISATLNHPFLVYRAEQVACRYTDASGICKQGANALCRRVKCKESDFGSPTFVHSKDLKVGDYIVSPKMDRSESNLDRAKMRLLGYYASEGSPSYKSAGKRNGIAFSLNIDEVDTIAKEISELFLFAFGKKARVYTNSKRNTTTVYCDSIPFLEFCLFHCGENSRRKILSEEVVCAPLHLSLEFLGAYWNGDGCFTDNSYTADTMSANMASQIFQMVRSAGFPAYHSNYYRPVRIIDGREYPDGIMHYISFPGRYQSEFGQYANHVDGNYSVHSTRVYLTSNEFGYLHKIESLETVHYEGPVYNIEVDGEGDRKSYIAHGLATHNTNEIVGSAIDFHTDVPMSKIRLSLPKGKDMKRNHQILNFYERMCKRIRLFQSLYDMTHEYWLQGGAFVFCEDHDLTDEIPVSLLQTTEETEEIAEIDYAGRMRMNRKPVESESDEIISKKKEEREKDIRKFVADRYQGWQKLTILPPEQVKMEVFQYTNKAIMELIPSEKDRLLVLKATEQYDDAAARIADDIPAEIRDNLMSGAPIPLNTSPYDNFLCSSFCFYLAHKKAAYEERGISLLERCHVPGTEVTTLRGGQTFQIPIEDLNPETDRVLGGSGIWRTFERGSREHSGTVITTNFNKLSTPVVSTPDHKMWILKDGAEVETTAESILAGDFVRLASVKSENEINQIDLHKFFSEEKWTYQNRESRDERPVQVIPEIIDGKMTLRHEWVDRNPWRDEHSEVLERVVSWISSLESDIVMLSSEFQAKFGVGKSVYRNLIRDLESLGYPVPVVVSDSKYKNFGRVFTPANIDISPLYQKTSTQDCPKELELTKDLGYILGYFLGDGTVDARITPTQYGPFKICYSRITPNSVKSIVKIKNTLDSLGLKHSDRDYKLSIVTVFGDWFARWISRNFGHNKLDKHLPSWITNSPEEFKLGLFSGLFDSDGWVTKSKKSHEYTVANIAMTTKDLVNQLTTLALSMRMTPSTRYKGPQKVKQANGQISDAKPQYGLVFGISDDLSRLQKGGSVKFEKFISHERGDGGRKHLRINERTYYSVKSVTESEYDGPVYSLNVDQDHSFFANFTLTANCLRTLNFRDKLRQSQSQIASRAMTPKRIIWADKMSEPDVAALRDQIDQALIDPDFSIVTNFEVHWDEIGARDRLLDLSTEYEITNKLLFIGLRITEPMLTGESSYSGERIHLDVMNTMYLLYRETIAEFVEQRLFEPVAEKKGFFEIDEYGNKQYLYPKLQFTRLALRDNTELQDFLFNLYQKGSVPVSIILDLLNIDADEAAEKIKADMWGPLDANFNEFIRNAMQKAGDKAIEDTDVVERISKNSGLKTKKKTDERFDKGGSGD